MTQEAKSSSAGGWRMVRRAFKVLSLLAGVTTLFFVASVVGVVVFYRSIVAVDPGSLDVNPEPGELGRSVNVFCGTGGIPWVCPYNSPAATTPFGMVRLGPDTASMLINQKGLNASGYYFGDNKIIGFSHTRLLGADALEGGHFRVFPSVQSSLAEALKKERASRFSHLEETAFPGYYAVRLPSLGVLAELTATPRVGVHRYTFTRDEPPHLLIDVTSVLGDHKTENGVVRILPEAQEIEGSVRTFGSFASRYGGLDVHFVARFSVPFTAYGTWTGGQLSQGVSQAAGGSDIGADVSFEKRDSPLVVEVRLALSYVSIANARANLETEAAGRGFDEAAGSAREAWEEKLSLIRLEGGSERQRRIFYTALYRAFQMPTVFNDVNDEYRGFDKSIHKAEGFRYFTDFSLWDTFRTVHPLYNLIAREDQRDMLRSLVEMAKAGGSLPRWAAGCGYTNCMMGTPADAMVAEAYLKGIRDFDIETAYAAMRQTALTGPPGGSRFAGRKGLTPYLKHGYCPSDKMSKAVSQTLEYAYEDHALSLLAKELGREEDAATFGKHGQFYRNLWNPATQYFQPRDSRGDFSGEFRPLLLTYTDLKGKYTDDYVEGSALQWRWDVPHDAEGLISLFESREYFVSELNNFFTNSKKKMGAWNPGSYYWHGNEPDIHAAYLFNAAGRPDLTQKWVRWILDTRYSDDFVGLDGNDDGGTLSAWYVLSALGFYPIAGTTRYELGAPLFEKAEVHIGDAALEITAENYAPENIYVQKVWLNNAPLDRTWFTHDEIAQGGALRFEMGKNPAAGPR
jgi:predicted alpha-1,2-mannosidase